MAGSQTTYMRMSEAEYKHVRHLAAIKSWKTRRRNAAARAGGAGGTYREGAVQLGGDWAQKHRIEAVLASTPMESAKAGGGGVSETYRVRLKNGMKGNFKTAEGERGGIRSGIRKGQQTEREIGAWKVAQLVGMDDMVAPAARAEYDVPGYRRYLPGIKEGVILKWQEGTPANDIGGFRGDPQMYGYMKAMEPSSWAGGRRKIDATGEAESHLIRADRELQRAAMFDFVIGNKDRHGGNWVVDEDDGGHIKLIDHGLSFAEESASPGTHPNSLLMDFAAEREKGYVTGLVNEDKSPGSRRKLVGSPRDFAKPYKERKGEILKALKDLKLPKAAIKGVSDRIDRAFSTDLWAELMPAYDYGGPS